jgi:hypothetical protein
MPIGTIRIGQLDVSRLVLGGNPFSGFSHQSPEMDARMRRYYTTERIKATLREAERLGVNTFLGRTDRHVARVLEEYWNEGGTIQWIAQTAPELATCELAVDRAVQWGAKACYLHGGQMDHWFLNDRLDDVGSLIARVHGAGLPAGIAGHVPDVHLWASENLQLDFHMCSYYCPTNRAAGPSTPDEAEERFAPEQREAMAAAIARIDKPVIHYKIFAAGRNDPAQAVRYAAAHMRPRDAVCIGVYTEDHPGMLQEDLALFEAALP